MDRWKSLTVFVRVAERRNFAAVARELKISPAMVGKHVRSIETRLGARLVDRTTRKQRLTEVGRVYYEHAQQALASLEAAEASAGALRAAPRGLLRVSAPTSFGAYQLAPALADYMRRYPDVRVELTLLDRLVDLLDEGYEAAVRVGRLVDSTLVARKLAPYRLAPWAAPSYLRARGTPKRPADLSGHNCLHYTHWWGGNVWYFVGPDGEHEVRVDGTLVLNNGAALLAAARRGLGVILQPPYLTAADAAAGRLERLLPAYEVPLLPMHVVYPSGRNLTPKLKTFLDFMVERFSVETVDGEASPRRRPGAAR